MKMYYIIILSTNINYHILYQLARNLKVSCRKRAKDVAYV